MAAASADENITDSDINGSVLDTPVISIDNSNVYTGDSVNIFLKDSNQTPLINQYLTANINNENHSLLRICKVNPV